MGVLLVVNTKKHKKMHLAGCVSCHNFDLIFHEKSDVSTSFHKDPILIQLYLERLHSWECKLHGMIPNTMWLKTLPWSYGKSYCKHVWSHMVSDGDFYTINHYNGSNLLLYHAWFSVKDKTKIVGWWVKS